MALTVGARGGRRIRRAPYSVGSTTYVVFFVFPRAIQFIFVIGRIKDARLSISI